MIRELVADSLRWNHEVDLRTIELETRARIDGYRIVSGGRHTGSDEWSYTDAATGETLASGIGQVAQIAAWQNSWKLDSEIAMDAVHDTDKLSYDRGIPDSLAEAIASWVDSHRHEAQILHSILDP